MTQKIISWAQKLRDEGSSFSALCKFLYFVGITSWVHAVVTIVCGIYVPIAISHKSYVSAVITLIFWILYEYFQYVCAEFRELLYNERKFDNTFLTEQNSLYNSLIIEVLKPYPWESNIFRLTSDKVCGIIYETFREVFRCNNRVSVEYTFEKNENGNNAKYIEMTGRHSNERVVGRTPVEFDQRKAYYSYRIFKENKEGVNVVRKDEIRKGEVWHRNHNNDIEMYVGIGVGVYDDVTVDYILQFDFLGDARLGDNNTQEEIEKFVKTYLQGYINILTLAYTFEFKFRNELKTIETQCTVEQ